MLIYPSKINARSQIAEIAGYDQSLQQ